MTNETARRMLAEARAAGFCGFCFARGEPGRVLAHGPACKAVNDAGIRRRAA
jgi:hypothetical protein